MSCRQLEFFLSMLLVGSKKYITLKYIRTRQERVLTHISTADVVAKMSCRQLEFFFSDVSRWIQKIHKTHVHTYTGVSINTSLNSSQVVDWLMLSPVRLLSGFHCFNQDVIPFEG